MTERAALILAGGRARRLGGILKPLIRIGDRSILDRQLDILRPLTPEIVLSTNQPDAFAKSGLRTIADNFPNAGPLAGIEAAFPAMSATRILVLAGDLPFPSAELIRFLFKVSDAQAVVPRTADGPGGERRDQPLFAVYDRTVAEEARRLLNAGKRKMQDLLEVVDTRRVDPAEFASIADAAQSFRNINEPEDLEIARRLRIEERQDRLEE